MSRFGQIVMGPAGSGKSTYTSVMKEYFLVKGKTVRLINLDPAAEDLAYEADIDIRDLITVDDIQEELDYGPNGGLLYAMEYMQQNLDFLMDRIDDFGDDEYFIIDCPGQVELYIHHPIMRQVVDKLQIEKDIRLCGVFCVDSTFIKDASKFVSAALMTLNCMVHLELPHINVLTKADLIVDDKEKQILDTFLDNEVKDLLPELNASLTHPKYKKLNSALVELLDEYKMVSYTALNPLDEESVELVAMRVNDLIQYYESLEVDDRALDRAQEREAEHMENMMETINENTEL